MRLPFAAILLFLASFTAEAKQSPYPPVTQFSGDRYVAQAQMGADVARAVKAKTGAKPRYLYPTRKRPPVTSQRWKHVPVPMPRPVTTGEYRVEAGPSEPISVFDGVKREAGRAIAGARPVGCPARAWCGCWLGRHLGMASRSLWIARNWAHVGSNVGRPMTGAIVVWRHHVGTITAVEGNRIRVLSGNDGRAVRDRWRSTAGVIAYRSPS